MVDMLGPETLVLLSAAGVVFVWALLLEVQKYAQVLGRRLGPSLHRHRAPGGAPLFVRAAPIAAFAELSDGPAWIDLTAELVQLTS